jgi:hypothetical protein
VPIVDVQVICNTPQQVHAVSAQGIADSLGQVFSSEPGRTWVRTHTIAATDYAENSVILAESELPAFVTVMHFHMPQGEALAIEVQAITAKVAKCIQRPESQIHVQYAAPGTGRQAFGGKLAG